MRGLEEQRGAVESGVTDPGASPSQARLPDPASPGPPSAERGQRPPHLICGTAAAVEDLVRARLCGAGAPWEAEGLLRRSRELG